MPLNEFDALLADLATVQRLSETGQFSKSLEGTTAYGELNDLQRRVSEIEKVQRQATRGAVPELGTIRTFDSMNRFSKALGSPSAPGRRPTTKEEARAKLRETAPEIMAAALAKLKAGKLTATEVSAIEARLHQMQGAVA